jgi:hypothetical protein
MRPRAPTRARQQEVLRGFDRPLFGSPSAMYATIRLAVGIRPSDRSTTQPLGQESQDPVEGDPGRMPWLVDEGDREHRERRRRDARRVARRRVDLDPLEGGPSVVRRVSNRSGGQPRSLVNRSPSTRRLSFARSVIVARSSASRPGAARPRSPIGAGMAGWLMTDATTDGSSAVASAKPPVKHIPTTPTPGPPHSR